MTRHEAEVAELPTEPGARLRRQRELAGLSEQQAAEQLNLDAGVVIALERDDFAALGAPVFARGHLKRYAALLGLSEEEVLGAYDRSRAQLAQPTLIPKAREEMPPERGPTRWPWLVGGVVLFLLAAAIAAYVSEYGLRLPNRAVLAPEQTSTPAKPVEAGPTPAANRAATSVGEGTQPGAAVSRADTTANCAITAAGVPAATSTTSPSSLATPAATSVAEGQLVVQFSFTTDSWVEVYDGSGKSVLYDLGKAGTERTVTGTAPMSVTFGNARAVQVRVNGQAFAVPAPPAGQTVARFSIGPGGSLR